jgi:hypothetical protein
MLTYTLHSLWSQGSRGMFTHRIWGCCELENKEISRLRNSEIVTSVFWNSPDISGLFREAQVDI